MFVLLAAAISLAVAIVLGVVWPSRLSVFRRIGAGRPLAPLVGVLFAGLVVWLVAPSLLLSGQAPNSSTTQTSTSVSKPSLREMVILNTTVPALAFAVVLLGDALVRPRANHNLGFGIRRLPRGVLGGVAGILLALPIIISIMALAGILYRQIGYETPTEHELLRAMHDTPDLLVKYLAIAAAVIVAPLWEELLFRGYIQTLIREGLIRMRESEPKGSGFPLGPLESSETPLSPPVVSQPADGPWPLQSWLAILATSALFAAVHPLWMMPPIFCLSLCFGLAYERTSSLWVPIVMHGSFNGLMTVYFLSQS